MAPGKCASRLAAHEALDIGLQFLGEAAQAMNVARHDVGLLVGRPVHFILESLERALREAQELEQVVRCGEGACA